MRKTAYLVGIILAAGLGGYLVSGPISEGRGQSWVQWHLDVIQKQLSSLKHHLILYKQTHGRYPTNDEGLGVLDNFESRFPADFAPDEAARKTINGNFYRQWSKEGQMLIDEYRFEFGSVPKNAEEFRSDLLWMRHEPPTKTERATTPVEVAFAEGENVFLITPAGVMTPWMVPYVYENRQGMDAGKFAGSPVERDKKGRYSVQVDQGVFIYSVGAELLSRRLDRLWWEDNSPRFVGLGLLAVAAILVVAVNRCSRTAVVAGVAAAAVGLAVFQTTRVTCYVMSPLFRYRDPEMVSRQRELLEQYHQRGVIADSTYEKALEGLHESE